MSKTVEEILTEETYLKVLLYKYQNGYLTTDIALKHIVEEYFKIKENRRYEK